MTAIQFDYLENTTGRNAFYLHIELGNGKSIYGWGSIGGAGQWKVDDTGKVQDKVKEKLREGYKDVKSTGNITKKLADRASTEYRKEMSRALQYVNGQFLDSNAPAGKAGIPRPKLRKGKSELDGWF